MLIIFILIVGFVVVMAIASINKRMARREIESTPFVPADNNKAHSAEDVAAPFRKKLGFSYNESDKFLHDAKFNWPERMLSIATSVKQSNSSVAVATMLHEIGHGLQNSEADKYYVRLFVLMRRSISKAVYLGCVVLALAVASLFWFSGRGMGDIAVLVLIIISYIALVLALSDIVMEYDATHNFALPALRETGSYSNEELAVAEVYLGQCLKTYHCSAAISFAGVVLLWGCYIAWPLA